MEGDFTATACDGRGLHRTPHTTGRPAERLVGGLPRILSLALLLLSIGRWVSVEPLLAGDRPAIRDGVPGGALDVNPCDLALAPHRGESDVDTEIARLQQLAAEPAKRGSALERLGWMFVEKARRSSDPGYFSTAEASARCLEEIDPANLQALLLRGHVDHSLHRFREAEGIGRALVARRGEWFDHALLGDALMERGQLDEAALHYQRMMDVRPGAQAYSRASHLRWLRGDLAGAVDLMRMAVRSVSPRSRESAAWLRTRLALLLMQLGESEAAANSIREALAIVPEYPQALLVRGRLLLAAGRPHEAADSLRRAAAISPLPDCQWVLLEALNAAGLSREGDAVRRQLVEHGAVNDARTTALYLASAGGNAAAALRLAQRENLARSDVLTFDALAWALAASERFAEAAVAARAARAEGTADARIFFHSGVIASRQGELRDAEQLLRRAAAIEHMLLPSEREQLHRERARLGRQLAEARGPIAG